MWSRKDIGLEILPILQRIFAWVLKTAIKTLMQNVKFVQTFLISHLAALRPILSHWQGDSLTYSMLITSQKPSNFECNVLSHFVILCRSVLKTTDHCFASFFSREYRSFSLSWTTSHTLSQCYYSNFKQVNVGWEVLR